MLAIRQPIRPVFRAFLLITSLAMLFFCARYYPVWVVGNFYHPEDANYWFWVICIPLFMTATYLQLVTAFGRWQLRSGYSFTFSLAMIALAVLASVSVVVGVLAWDFRQS